VGEQVDRVGREGRRAERVLVLLAGLAGTFDAGEVDELTHALQVATHAERAGHDDEVVLAGLCHDVGKVFGDAGHGGMAAALLAPHVREDIVEVVRHHSAFTARHWGKVPAGTVDPREQFHGAPWFDLAVRFVDEWDMRSFDPSFDTPPLEHFAPVVHRLVTGP
jgi:predicted HD phosphohydrolase